MKKNQIEKLKTRKVWIASGFGFESIEAEESTAIEAKINEIIERLNNEK